MSTTESIASSQTSLSSWRKSDTTWTLGLFGTAIGAGVLFFPIRAGFGGLIPILVMLVLATYYSAALAIAGMYFLRCLHPPGGAVALTAILGGAERVFARAGFEGATMMQIADEAAALPVNVAPVAPPATPALDQQIAVAETGSISAAAQAVFISQSTLTLAIQQLEEEIGVSLFNRHAKGMTLTHQGHQFLRQAHLILATVDNAKRSLQQSTDQIAGQLIVGVTSLVAGYYLADLLTRYRAAGGQRERDLLSVRSRDVQEHIERVVHHVRRLEQTTLHPQFELFPPFGNPFAEHIDRKSVV